MIFCLSGSAKRKKSECPAFGQFVFCALFLGISPGSLLKHTRLVALFFRPRTNFALIRRRGGDEFCAVMLIVVAVVVIPGELPIGVYNKPAALRRAWNTPLPKSKRSCPVVITLFPALWKQLTLALSMRVKLWPKSPPPVTAQRSRCRPLRPSPRPVWPAAACRVDFPGTPARKFQLISARDSFTAISKASMSCAET